MAAPPGSAVHDALRGSGIQTHLWDAAREPGPRVPAEVATLRRISERVDPDLLHLHSAKAGLCGRLAVRGRKPTVFQPHAWSFEAADRVLRTAALAWERFAARWTTALVCVSLAERDRGLDAGIEANWSVIPNGVDLGLWTTATDTEKLAARRELDDRDDPIAVSVGRLSRQKGHDVLLEAWKLVESALPAARLFVVGDGPERSELESAAPSSVRFVGPSDRVATWLAAADVVVLPSRWEGMSLAMLEAMARGRSVVTTDVSGAREAVGDAAGAVVPVEDAAALATAIVVRLRDRTLAQREAQEGRKRIEEIFNLESVVRSLTSLYADLLGTPHA